MATILRVKTKFIQLLSKLVKRFLNYWHRGLLQKILSVLVAVLIIITSLMYGVGQWYIQKHKNDPLTFGATFIAPHARSYGLDAQATMQATIQELGIKRFRLVSYWDEIEKQQGTYDFSDLDWQFAMAKKYGATISLAIGLRQPRWPECHMPSWARQQSVDVWYPQLRTFITTVVNHYKSESALVSYQLENEFFMSVFGDCPDFSRSRLVDEFNLVKSLDTKPVIVSRSNNWVGVPLGDPRPDIVGISVYKRVWDKTFTHRYFEYPLPPIFYASLAGATQLFTGRDTFIHELQAESWLPEGYSMLTASTEEMYKSMNPERLKNRLSYAESTGMRTIDLWGVEWWYYMKQKRNAPELWNTAKDYLLSR